MDDSQNNKPPLPQRDPQNRPGKKPPLPRYKRGPFSYLVIIFAIITVLMMMQPWHSVKELRFDEFVEHVLNENIDNVTVKDTEIAGDFNQQYLDGQPDKPKKAFRVHFNPDVHGEWLGQLLKEHGVKNKSAPQRIWLIMLIQWVLPLLLLIGFFYFFLFRNIRSGAGGMLMSFGRSKHRLQGKDRTKVTFEDVAGVEEAKDEVAEIIEFLRNPRKFQRL
ncbi:MAG: ATP-dependent metallopeptidase FtsH/Yme1/Tma family protein, partial [Planctomycetota bacterium]